MTPARPAGDTAGHGYLSPLAQDIVHRARGLSAAEFRHVVDAVREDIGQRVLASRACDAQILDTIATMPRGTHSCRLLVRCVEAVTGVSAADLIGRSRVRETAQARQILYWLCRRFGVHGRASLPEIGRLIGGRDHTSARSGILRVEALRENLRLTPPDNPVAWAGALWLADWSPEPDEVGHTTTPRYAKATPPRAPRRMAGRGPVDEPSPTSIQGLSLAAVRATDAPMSAREIGAWVATHRGREIARESLAPQLSRLCQDGRLVNEGGRYRT